MEMILGLSQDMKSIKHDTYLDAYLKKIVSSFNFGQRHLTT